MKQELFVPQPKFVGNATKQYKGALVARNMLAANAGLSMCRQWHHNSAHHDARKVVHTLQSLIKNVQQSKKKYPIKSTCSFVTFVAL
jgi:hypothetical protein